LFKGFPKEGIAFLRELSRNNNRDWFQPRKETFESSVKAPMLELVEEVNKELAKFAADHVTDPAKAVYRIYRDTRFSKDKTPYKTHIAANFPRRGVEKHAGAGFYFHVSPKEVLVAGGVYMPGPEQLLAIRTWLTANHREFLKVSKAAEKLVSPLQGESLSRPPKGFACDHPAVELIRMKQWLWWANLDVKLVTTPELASEIASRFRAMAPGIAMLNTPLTAGKKKAAAAPPF
jgi:uncharacterized protein (TIGR02453 family)